MTMNQNSLASSTAELTAMDDEIYDAIVHMTRSIEEQMGRRENASDLRLLATQPIAPIPTGLERRKRFATVMGGKN